RLTARGGSLVRRHVSVALDQLHTIERHRELIGYQLELRRVDTLTELAFSCTGGNGPVGVHGNPRIKLSRIDVRHPRPERSLRERKALDQRGGAERHNERARALEKHAARGVSPHARLSLA